MAPTATAIGELEGYEPWTPKDRRRHDAATIIFNSALAAYAKSAASASGARLHLRREMLQNAERMLLEAASQTHDPITHNKICVRPDIVSFNTIITAWGEFAPRSPPQPSCARSTPPPPRARAEDDIDAVRLAAVVGSAQSHSLFSPPQPRGQRLRVSTAAGARAVGVVIPGGGACAVGVDSTSRLAAAAADGCGSASGAFPPHAREGAAAGGGGVRPAAVLKGGSPAGSPRQ